MEKLLTIVLATCGTCFVALSFILVCESLNKKKYFRVYIHMKERIKGSVKWKFRSSEQVKKAA